MEERLQKIISRAGLASRRAAEQMIREGRVRVDGRIVKELGAKADPARSDIRVDGQRVRTSRRRRYLLVNKPAGYVTTCSDPSGRRTVMDLLPPSLRSVYPAGRLDMATTGLLLLTDDGQLAQRVTHPRYGIEKTYVATVSGVPKEKTLLRAQKGIRVEGEKLCVQAVKLLFTRPRPTAIEVEKKDKSRLRIVLLEGKHREIRRLFQALGHPVLELHRSRVGCLTDRGLPVGAYRALSPDEVRRLLKHQAVATTRRGPRKKVVAHRGRRGATR